MKALGMMGAAAWLAACGPDCRETSKMADFEFSQRNYERAEKLYLRAWERDSLGCPEVRDKLERTREFLGR